MANYATLKSAIQQVIKTNGNNEITGALLQQSLLTMINSLGADYQFVGVAQPSTNPGTPDQNVFYIAGAGTYPNFNNFTVPDGYLGVMKYNGSWANETIQVGKNYDDEINDLAAETRIKGETTTMSGHSLSSLGAYAAGTLEFRSSTTYYFYIYRIPANTYYNILRTGGAPGDTFIMAGIVNSLADFVVGGYMSKALLTGNQSQGTPITYFAKNETLVVILGSSSSDTRYSSITVTATYNAASKIASIEPEIASLAKTVFGEPVIDTFINGAYINTSGTETVNNNYCHTDYVPVNPGMKFLLRNFYGDTTNAKAFFYDENKNPISGSAVQFNGNVLKTITVPNSAYFARFSYQYKTGSTIFYPTASIVILSNIGAGISEINGKIGAFDVPFEYGTIVFSGGTFNYSTANTRIRTINDKTFFLNKGDVIKLSNYSAARFIVGWKKEDGTFGGSTTWLTADYTVRDNGYFVIVVAYQNDAVIANVNDLAQLVIVSCQRSNANLMDKIATLEQGVIDVQNSAAFSQDGANWVTALAFERAYINTSGVIQPSTTRLLSAKITGKEGIILVDSSQTATDIRVLWGRWIPGVATVDYMSLWLTDKAVNIPIAPGYEYYIELSKPGDGIITLDDIAGLGIYFEKGDIITCNKEFLPNVANLRRPFHRYTSSATYKDCIIFAWFSDIHANTENIRRIAEFRNRYANFIDDFIQTGDVIASNLSGGMPTNWAAKCPYVLGVIGNHDAQNKEGGAWVTQPQTVSYNTVFAPFISGWNVIQPENAAANGYCYWYKDYNNQSLRLVALDCMHWDATQLAWFTSVLESARTGNLSVIVAVHYLPFAMSHSDTAFDSIDFTPTSSAGDFFADPEIANAVAAFINNGGKFVCYLTGHVHIDLCGVGASPNNNQICISIATASASNDATIYGDTARVVGTKSQDCVNIIAIDTTSKTIKIYRIGVDHDRYMRTKKHVCWNYETQTLIK